MSPFRRKCTLLLLPGQGKPFPNSLALHQKCRSSGNRRHRRSSSLATAVQAARHLRPVTPTHAGSDTRGTRGPFTTMVPTLHHHGSYPFKVRSQEDEEGRVPLQVRRYAAGSTLKSDPRGQNFHVPSPTSAKSLGITLYPYCFGSYAIRWRRLAFEHKLKEHPNKAEGTS